MITPHALLLMTAAVGAACGVVRAVDQYLLHGVRAAGYWWSKHDRERGPGC